VNNVDLYDQSKHRHISHGQLLVAMILNGLGFVNRSLHIFSEFLKKPERIQALRVVMTCSLMIYAALEHLIQS
jgi:hypothetical protein